MKNFCAFMLLLLTVAIHPNLNAIDFAKEWNWMHPYPTANSLTVTTSKLNLLAIGGDNGFVAVSTNNGVTWEQKTIQSNEAIAAINLNYYPDKLIVITKSGLIFDTESGTSLTSVSAQVNGFNFDENGSRMWLACNGGKLAFSSNGTSWNTKSVSGVTGNITSIFFFADNGWLTTDNGQIFHSSNNGENWTAQSTGFILPIYKIYFVDGQNGWAACESGKVLHTTDGGNSWSEQVTTNLFSLNACYFENANTGWVSGKFGSLFHTTDAGTTWTDIKLENVYGDLNSMTNINGKIFISGTNGEVLVGEASSSNFTVISANVTSFNLKSISTYGDKVLAVGDNGLIIYSFDKGKNWQECTSNITQGINACQFFNTDTAYLATKDGKIYHSFNGGTTWTSQTIVNDKEFHDLYCKGSKGVLVGFKSAIFLTNNTGKNWTMAIVNTPTPIELFGVSLDGDNGLACGANGGIVKTTDGGENWLKITAITTETLNGIYLSGNNGLAVGNAGTVLKTTDAGSSWTKIDIGTTEQLNKVYISHDANNALIVGKNGIMYRTSDGTNWSKIQISATQNIYGLCTSEDNSSFSAWICGGSGMIMSHNVATSSVKDFTQRNDINLDIFPNPATNVVNIKNSKELSNINFVRFFNLLGDAVLEIPVNINTDIYEFNVESLNSGIYIIKLYSDSESYSVRMIKE